MCTELVYGEGIKSNGLRRCKRQATYIVLAETEQDPAAIPDLCRQHAEAEVHAARRRKGVRFIAYFWHDHDKEWYAQF